MKKWIENRFKLRQLGSDFRTEIIAGLTTFSAMSYILAVHPATMAAAGMEQAALVTVTALASAFGCLLMGGLANSPVALAPGMGINAFFAYTVCGTMGIPWQAALGCVFWNGILFFLLTLTGMRRRLFDCVPPCLKIGVQCGIGLFIAFIGLSQSGLIVDHPVTLVTMGEMPSAPGLMVLGGVVLIVGLQNRGIPGAILIGIIVVALLGLWIRGEDGEGFTRLPEQVFSKPVSMAPTLLQVDFLFPLRQPAVALPIVFSFLFVDLFDTLGTLVGVTRSAKLLDDKGNYPQIQHALAADSLATVGGALMGTSTVTSYIESTAGVRAGGRTGLTSWVVAGCFVLSLFLTPLILSIPVVATAPALIVIGLMMMDGMRDLKWGAWEDVFPALMVLIVMPLAYSISEGIAVGFIVYVLLRVLSGRFKEIDWVTGGLAVLFLLRFLWPD
jgi:AGZA family xanthine/uracil permease-like MFS transporter